MQAFLPLLISLIILFLFFHFTIIKPQKKQQQIKAEMINSLKVGDKIETTAGIVGKVLKVNEDTFEVQTLDSKIEFRKYALIGIITQTEDSKGE